MTNRAGVSPRCTGPTGRPAAGFDRSVEEVQLYAGSLITSGATMRLRPLSGAGRPLIRVYRPSRGFEVLAPSSRRTFCKPARAYRGLRLALASRTDSSASLVASVKNRSADERV
jgi:hypothetical protein